jgi:hypothetical protein
MEPVYGESVIAGAVPWNTAAVAGIARAIMDTMIKAAIAALIVFFILSTSHGCVSM